MLTTLGKNGKKLLSLDATTTIKTIKTSCKIKSKIVEQDEKEKGIREILNFGQTFGHAIESFTGFSKKRPSGCFFVDISS